MQIIILPSSVQYNGVYYYYLRNAQGDVIGIVNSSGTRVVTYTYDAWGNPLSTAGSMASTLGALNPLRYRGYVYDTETGLYYLQSRYYDPEICRFINADGYASTGQGLLGANAFTYCEANPVSFADDTGKSVVVAIMASISAATIIRSIIILSPIVNCYAYALKMDENTISENRTSGSAFHRKPQPGDFSNNTIGPYFTTYHPSEVKQTLENHIAMDAQCLGMYFSEVNNANTIVNEGNWLIAAAYDIQGGDYHFWRREDNGTWTHKPGSKAPRNTDNSNNIIWDPSLCDRGIYETFLGYYEIGYAE